MNYFIALVDIGLRCYEKAGVSRDLALQLLKPILAGAAANVTRLGPTEALTGPVARGDVSVVERQLAALAEWQPELHDLYAALGAQAVDISAQAGNASESNLDRLREIFQTDGVTRS